MSDLANRLAEARRAGDPAPEEFERLVSLLARSGYEPGEKLTTALEGLARWTEDSRNQTLPADEPEPYAAAPYPQDQRRAAKPENRSWSAAPLGQPIPEELERKLTDLANSLSQRPKAERRPQPAPVPAPVAARPPIPSLRSALADISARQRDLDSEDVALAPAPVRARAPVRPAIGERPAPDYQRPEPAAPAYERHAPTAPARPEARLAPDPAAAVAAKELRSEIDRLGLAVGDLPTRAEVDGLVREMGALASRLGSDRPARLDRDSLAAIDQLVTEVDRMRGDAASPQMITQLAEELHAISARLDVIGPKNSVAIDTLARRVDDVKAELDSFPRASALDGVAFDIQSLIARLDAQERIAAPTRDAVVGLSGRVESLDGKIAAIQQASAARDDALERINHAIRAELDNMPRAEAVSDLGRQIDALTEGLKSRTAMGPALKAVEGLADRVESLDGKIDALAASRGGDAEGFGRQIETLTATVRAYRPEPVNGAIEALSGNLAGQIAGLGDRLDKVAALTRDRGVSIDRIEAMTESLATRRSETNDGAIDALSGRIDGLGDRMEQMAAATRARALAFERIEDSVRTIAEHLLVERAGTEGATSSALEAEVTRLVEGLDRSDDRIDDLHAAFAGLATRIERSCVDLGAHCVESAVSAARDIVGTGSVGGRALDDEISRAIDELRASSAQSERRSADTLEAVHNTLERLLDRMDRQPAFSPPAAFMDKPARSGSARAETAGAETARTETEWPERRVASAPAPAIDATEAARAAARRALEEIAGGEPEPAPQPRMPRAEPSFQPFGDLAPDHPIEPGAGARAEPTAAQTAASFIAAARRAAAQPALDDEPQATSRAPRDAAGPSRFAGVLETLKARRRPLLLGVAATLIVLAALYVASGMTGQPAEPAPEPAPLSQNEPAPEPRAAADASPALIERRMVVTEAVRPEFTPEARTVPSPSAPPAAAHAEAAPVVPSAPVVAAAPALAAPSPSAALLAPPRAPAKDLTGFAFAGAGTKTRTADWKAGEPVTTGSIARNSDDLPDQIGGATLRMRAVAGDPSAQLEVADRLLDGRNVEADPAAAARWLEKAAAQGLAPAQHRLGSLYEKGRGVARDVGAARGLYEKAAASGNVRAMHNLGVVHAEGGLGKPDFGAATTWFRMAADRGLVDSQYNLAVLCARGLGGKRDLVEAYKWFALAAIQGDQDAAKKRDEVGKALGASVGVAKTTVEQFRPHAVDAAANDAPTPPGGWDKVAAVGQK